MLSKALVTLIPVVAVVTVAVTTTLVATWPQEAVAVARPAPSTATGAAPTVQRPAEAAQR